MKYLAPLILVVYVLTATSCKQVGNNKIFETLEPSSAQYKAELIKEFLQQGTTNLTFIFNGIENTGGQDYMRVAVNGNGFDAKGLILINNWNKLEDIKRTQGMGYIGAELKDLKLNVINVNGEQTLVYTDLDKIID